MREIYPNEKAAVEAAKKGAIVPEIVDVAVVNHNPNSLIAMAIDKGAGVETLEKLMALQERWEANEARKAYHKAMAAFKADPPTIIKTKLADFTTARGRTTYKYANLAGVAAAVGQALGPHGLSASWSTNDQGDRIAVTCTITHEMGHSESCTLSASADQSGGKNSIQAVGSTISYLEKYTLLALSGLAADEMDDDANGTPDSLAEDQVANIRSLLAETKADEAKFLQYFKVKTVEDLPAARFKEAKTLLERKKNA